jgi:hypothetical protein
MKVMEFERRRKNIQFYSRVMAVTYSNDYILVGNYYYFYYFSYKSPNKEYLY